MTASPESTDLYPVRFFEVFVNNQNLQKFENQFYYPINPSQKNFKEEGYVLYLKSVCTDKDVPEIKIIFKENLLSKLKSNAEISLALIIKRRVTLEYNGINHDDYYNIQINKLEKLKLNIIDYKFQNEIIDVIDNLSKEIKKCIKSEKVKRTIFKQDNLGNSYFQILDKVNYSRLEKLYKICLELEIFDESSSSEEIFIKVFTTSSPGDVSAPLKFNCNNQLALLFFNTINPWFKKLIHSRIDKSKLFMNKGNNIFNQRMLDSTNNRLKNKIEKYKLEEIAINSLIKSLK